jgi:spoIIIJ-associated protein
MEQKTNQNHEKISEFVRQLFSYAGFPPEDVSTRINLDICEIDVSIPDAGLVIGEDGVNLSAWEQVIRVICQKFIPGIKRVVLDINQYRAIKNNELRQLARKAAREAVLTKKPVELPVMNAYERRIIHTELALRPDVMTESVGEDPNRRVVVKPLLNN